VIIVISPATGETSVLIDRVPARLRGPGAAGEPASPDFLAAAAQIAGVDEEVVLALHHFVLSIQVSTP
jgi:hypothetical protein